MFMCIIYMCVQTCILLFCNTCVFRYYYSAVDILDLVETRFFTSDPAAMMVFGDMRSILRGVTGIQTLKNMLAVNIPVSDVSVNLKTPI